MRTEIRKFDLLNVVVTNMGHRVRSRGSGELNRRSIMCGIRVIYVAVFLFFFSGLSVFGQWSPIDSGTTSNLNGAILLDSGTGFVVGETGTILKSTDAGATWTQ